MIAFSHQFGGVTATVYYLDTGEKVSRHQHPFEHTTSCLLGQTKVEIFDGRPIIHCLPAQKGAGPEWETDIMLPANIDHEITAVLDSTIVLNLSLADASGTLVPPALSGGIAMADGTVIHGP